MCVPGVLIMNIRMGWQNLVSAKPVTGVPDDATALSSSCPSCHSVFLGPYCVQCGQPRDVHRRHLGKLIHDVLKDIISFDSRITRTLAAMMLRPGELTAAFREGRTQKYVPAVRLYLFSSLFFFVILSMAHIAIFQLQISVASFTMEKNAAGQTYIIKNGHKERLDADEVTETIKQQGSGPVYYSTDTTPLVFAPVLPEVKKLSATLEKTLNQRKEEDDLININNTKINVSDKVRQLTSQVAHNPAALNKPLGEWIARVLFLLLPVFALLLAFFYVRHRKEYYFVDHLVFSLNFHSFAFALLLIAAALKQTSVGMNALYAIPYVLWFYLLLSLRRVYRQNWFKTVVKSFGLSMCYFFFQTLALIIIIFGVLGVIPENIIPGGGG